ncbi:unnamed protein product, partial [Iphiclides podalirius]
MQLARVSRDGTSFGALVIRMSNELEKHPKPNPWAVIPECQTIIRVTFGARRVAAVNSAERQRPIVTRTKPHWH